MGKIFAIVIAIVLAFVCIGFLGWIGIIPAGVVGIFLFNKFDD